MKKGLVFTKYNSLFNPELIINLNNSGLNATEISQQLQIPSRRFGEMLIHYNLKLKGKYQILSKNETFFDTVDSEIKAYLLGYLIADGCISIEPKKRNNKVYSYNKRVLFCSSIDDKSVIDLYVKYICPNNSYKIFNQSRGAKNRKDQINFKFSSKYMVDILISKYKIIPRKTYDINFEFPFDTIPKVFRRDFIRGFFDGDGWVENEGKGIAFVGTSKEFLLQIVETVRGELPDSKYRLENIKGKTVDYFKVHIRSKYLHKYLYSKSNFFLKRKEIKFINK